MNTVDTVSLEDTMAESEWIRKFPTELQARSGQNARGDAPILKLPACLRKPVERYTPKQWQFGLHNRDPQASSSESEVLKISLAAACQLKPDNWENFCAAVVDNPADMMLNSYGIYPSVTELSTKEVQYLLTLDALTLVLVLSSYSRAPESEPDQAPKLPFFFLKALVDGGFDIEDLLKVNGVAYCAIWDDLLLCENQIPMALIKRAITSCYGLLPEERKFNYFVSLRQLDNPDSNVTTTLLDRILKNVACNMCCLFFAEPCPDIKANISQFIDVNYTVDKLENCAHVFACIHRVMTTTVWPPPIAVAMPPIAVAAPPIAVAMPPIAVAAPPIAVAMPPIAVATRFVRAVATGLQQLASVIATIRFGKEIAPEESFSFVHVIQSATTLKKAGLQIKGIPGMVKQVAFKDGCLFLPIMIQSERLESYICNMATYETWNTPGPYPFMDYLVLMSHLIKTPEDVSYLVDCGVIRAFLGTQPRIFQMWERLQIGLWFPDYSDKYRDNIVKPINRHCASPLNVMRTDFYNTFCSRWWLVISVLSAIILLLATLIQTYVLVTGSDKMQPHFPRGG
ncbi:hypothetical protein CY35_08G137500 [Sphagnum magellanicum]|nr:hypothetical protein CY35_08G137500 [Sphagnum magellanicum]